MSIKKWGTEVVKEGKRVRWPKRDILIGTVVTVLLISLFFGLLLTLEDMAGNRLIEILRDAFNLIK